MCSNVVLSTVRSFWNYTYSSLPGVKKAKDISGEVQPVDLSCSHLCGSNYNSKCPNCTQSAVTFVFSTSDLFHCIMEFIPIEERAKSKYARVNKTFYNYTSDYISSLNTIQHYMLKGDIPKSIELFSDYEDKEVMRCIAIRAVKGAMTSNLLKSAQEELGRKAQERESTFICLQSVPTVSAAIAISCLFPTDMLKDSLHD